MHFLLFSRQSKNIFLLISDHMISYDMPQGQQKGKVKGSNLDLYDMIYDGDIPNQFLSGGLGQLTGVLTVVEFVSQLSDLRERPYNTCLHDASILSQNTSVCFLLTRWRARAARLSLGVGRDWHQGL